MRPPEIDTNRDRSSRERTMTMGAQIRTWDKREESIDDSVIVISEERSTLRIDEGQVTAVNKLELILQLRELQEPDDRNPMLYAV